MPKTTAQLAASRAGETAETNGFGAQERPLRPAGVYQLKNKEGEVVDTLILKTHPKFGDGQAAAAERVGYEFVRAARKDEVKTIEVDVLALSTEDKNGNTSDDVKGLKARMNEQDQLIKTLQDQLAGKTAEDTKGSADGDVKAGAKEDAKEEAAARVAARQDGSVDTGVDETRKVEELKGNEPSGDPLSNDSATTDGDEDESDESEKSLSNQNRAELEATAEREGVELTEAEDTNKKIAAKIKASRDEKEGK